MFFRRFLCVLLLVLLHSSLLLRANTTALLGNVRQFSGPGDPNLDLLGRFDYAINFSPDDPVRVVNGVSFTPDNKVIAGATFISPQNIAGWQTKPEFGATADANALEEIMYDIRWADNGSGQKVQATLKVTPGLAYKIQVLISGNGPENRRWDIRFNGLNAVDEITSLGASPGQSYAQNRSTVWTYEFTPAGSQITVEMGNFFGVNDGGDRNPIWQALTLERVAIPPTPEAVSLSADQFFPTQTAYIGKLAVTDEKFGATHVISFVGGVGAADNAKFSLSGSQLLPAPFNFASAPAGSTYAIRLRATDAADPARFMEQNFTVTLVAPHGPVDVTLNVTSLNRGLIAGQLAGVISAVDADPFDRPLFSLVPGEGAEQNSLFTLTGHELRLAAALPAGIATVSLRVRAVDLAGLGIERILLLPLVDPQISIKEVLAVATSASLPLDENAQPADWIELHNEKAQAVNLTGWHLSDDPGNPGKWTFPALTLEPDGYLLIFADGSNAVPAEGPVHTNFSISQGGERLVLARPDLTIVSDVRVPEQYPNVTWGVGAGGPATGYLLTATPGAANAGLAAPGRNEVLFSVPHGFATAAFPLVLTATAADSVIHYTLDGTVPTAAAPIYQGPITITPVAGTVQSGTRIVRAVARHPGAAYTPVATQTYLFVNGTTSPTINGIVGQSNFYSSIRNHPVYRSQIDDGLLSLPVVSIINSAADLPYCETGSSLELFDPTGAEAGFSTTAGITRTGTTSLGYAKGSLSVRFRGAYGAGRLKYPLFAHHPHDAQGAASEFQEIRLRSGSHDTMSWAGTAENPGVPYGSPPVTRSGDAQFVRNIWIEDQQLLMGQPGKHGRMVNLFVNGNYHGIYHIQEHADDDYMGTYFPGPTGDFHYTAAGVTGSQHGNDSWNAAWSQMKASLTDYTQARRWVDAPNLADYMLLHFYIGNDWDWWTNHNWSAAGPRLPDQGGWKFFAQDQDISLQDVNADCTDQAAPDNIFNLLMAHPDFRVLFRDRAYHHLFHDGVLTPAKAAASYQLRTNEINLAVVAETARWQPASSVGPLPWDRDGEWTVEKNYLMNTWFPQRPAKLLTQLRSRGWYPVDAPEMSQTGGSVSPGAPVYLTGPAGATIYYTVDGSDPRLPGGAVNPTAEAYRSTLTNQVLIQPYDDIPGQGAVWSFLVGALDPGPDWKEPGYDASAWPAGASELGYGDGDEVTNTGSVDTDPVSPGVQKNITTYFRRTFTIGNPAAVAGLNLRLKRDDGTVVYLNGREVFRSAIPNGSVAFNSPGNLGVNVADDGNTWFPKTLVPADYTLNAGSNLIAVEVHNASAGSSDISFDLELAATVAAAAQPIAINGPLVIKARALAGGEWSALNAASFYLTGTQAADPSNLTLTEIQYHPEGGGENNNEFLEFTNTGPGALNLSGVQITGAVTFTFPAGLVPVPGERVVVIKDQALFDARYRTVGSPWYHAGIRVAGVWNGSLANSGEEIIIQTAGGAPPVRFSYEDSGSWPGRADGSGSSLELVDPSAAPLNAADKSTFLGSADHWRPSSEFHGSPGYAGLGPDRRVVINEVHSAPAAPEVDFIELFNTSASPQSLGGWFLSDTSANYRKYRFPPATSLAAGDYALLTEAQFNQPADPNNLVPFSLSSTGDDVFLLQADSAGNLLRFADRVEFRQAPGALSYGRWPDGTGSVELLSQPTPGAVNTAAIPAYAGWMDTAFPAGTLPADLSPGADPDHDGLTNFMEFAARGDPLAPTISPLRLTSNAPLQFEFTLRHDVRGLIQVSPDLSHWDPSEAEVLRLSTVNHPDGTTTVTGQLTSTPGVKRFVRLGISF